MILDKPQLSKGYCFNKNQRLRKPPQFKQVYRDGDWGSNAHFSFNVVNKLATNPGNCPDSLTLRLGITVSKKVSGLAVERNRIKRQVREFFRKQAPKTSGVLLHADLIITARPACRNISNLQIQQSLQHLWRKIDRWNQQQANNETNR